LGFERVAPRLELQLEALLLRGVDPVEIGHHLSVDEEARAVVGCQQK
jgi:hypothetical protein